VPSTCGALRVGFEPTHRGSGPRRLPLPDRRRGDDRNRTGYLILDRDVCLPSHPATVARLGIEPRSPVYEAGISTAATSAQCVPQGSNLPCHRRRVYSPLLHLRSVTRVGGWGLRSAPPCLTPASRLRGNPRRGESGIESPQRGGESSRHRSDPPTPSGRYPRRPVTNRSPARPH
jgi:hypothetical protein